MEIYDREGQYIEERVKGLYATWFKRALDIVLAGVMMLVSSWLFLLISLCYLLTLEFPIFFTQARAGKGDRPFTIWKFRTLSTDTTVPLSDRRFMLGNILRSSNLDELPQLWNILRGDMSFVGPRPLPVEYLPLYSDEQRRRHTIRPGVTGWAQVNGRHAISWSQKFSFDLYYVEHRSLALDMKIIAMTVVLMLSMKKDVSLSEKPFTGEPR